MGYSSVVECIPLMYEVSDLIPSTTNTMRGGTQTEQGAGHREELL